METSRERYIPALGYRFLTPIYDPIVSFTCREKTFKSHLLAQAGIQHGNLVLDVGCGTGTLAVQMKKTIPEADILCIDGDLQVLSIARGKARKNEADIRFSCCFSTQLPFPENSFDRIVSSLFFHHLSKTQKIATLDEMHRMLKPGGQLHVADWGKPTNMIMRFLFYFIQMLDGFNTTSDNVKGLLPALFRQCGFDSVEVCKNFSTIFGTISLYKAVKPTPAEI
jgi:ubiquinone/menaquinone biosynthesis C-methylase UbiE